MNQMKFVTGQILLLELVAEAVESGRLSTGDFAIIAEMMAELLEIRKVAKEIVAAADAKVGKKETIQ